MKRKRNKQYLSELYKHWIHKIIQELCEEQSNRVIQLNECYWYPTSNSNDELLKKYYYMEYILRKLKYFLYEKDPDNTHTYIMEKEDLVKFFNFLQEQNITTQLTVKYKEKLELHYPDIFK